MIRMETKRNITRKREGNVTMVRGGFCWCKITKHKRGEYSVAYGWKDEFTAIPGRTIKVGSYNHAIISAEGWINDYGW